jgi:hypothetical protein
MLGDFELQFPQHWGLWGDAMAFSTFQTFSQNTVDRGIKISAYFTTTFCTGRKLSYGPAIFHREGS